METEFLLNKKCKKDDHCTQVKKKPDGSPEMHHSPDDLII